MSVIAISVKINSDFFKMFLDESKILSVDDLKAVVVKEFPMVNANHLICYFEGK